jgi:archaemetzincin
MSTRPAARYVVAIVAAAALAGAPAAAARGAGGELLDGVGEATIALAPIGRVDARTLRALAPIVAERFAARVLIVAPVPLPRDGWDAGRGQWRTAALLDALAATRRDDWERMVGVTDGDLFAPELNFVFGEADPARRVAVFSTARLFAGADRGLFTRRMQTEIVHELGHTYGLGHCRERSCVMWFSNTLAESDDKGVRFCELHLGELQRALARLRHR